MSEHDKHDDAVLAARLREWNDERADAVLADKLREWFSTLSRIGASVEDDSMQDVLRVASDMRRMAREAERRSRHTSWRSNLDRLDAELKRLGLDLPPGELNDSGSVENWHYVINLDRDDVIGLWAKLTHLDDNREQL